MKITVLALTVATLLVGWGKAAPYDDAFLSIWNIHVQRPDDHEGVAAACRAAIARLGNDDSAALGPYLPVVQTIEGWRLLQAKRTAEATTAFEAALDRGRGGSDTRLHAADTVARRWLSRIDREQVVVALDAYHREHVAFPDDLAVFQTGPVADQPPLRDRKNEPWGYQLVSFRRLKAGGQQRYALFSRSIGRETSALDVALALRPSDVPITFVRKNTGTPALAEFRIGSGTSQPVVVQEGARSGGLRFVAIDGLGRFALLCDDDFWLMALPPAGGRR